MKHETPEWSQHAEKLFERIEMHGKTRKLGVEHAHDERIFKPGVLTFEFWKKVSQEAQKRKIKLVNIDNHSESGGFSELYEMLGYLLKEKLELGERMPKPSQYARHIFPTNIYLIEMLEEIKRSIPAIDFRTMVELLNAVGAYRSELMLKETMRHGLSKAVMGANHASDLSFNKNVESILLHEPTLPPGHTQDQKNKDLTKHRSLITRLAKIAQKYSSK